jgi:hypothetical protein
MITPRAHHRVARTARLQRIDDRALGAGELRAWLGQQGRGDLRRDLPRGRVGRDGAVGVAGLSMTDGELFGGRSGNGACDS